MKGDPFTLICSVMVDFSTIVDLTWSTPNPRAIADHRLSQPDTVHRNLSWPGTHLKLVEQVINILHFGIGILCSLAPALGGISVIRVGSDTFGDPIFQKGLQN